MKAVRVKTDMVGRRDVKLEGRLVVLEEQALHLLHFLPGRAPILPGSGYMVPALASRRDDRDSFFVNRGRHPKQACFVITSKAIEALSGFDVAKFVEGVEVFHGFSSFIAAASFSR